jgi:cytochrome c biogenesis protein CcdA
MPLQPTPVLLATGVGGLFLLVLIGIGIGLYFLPTVVALNRAHHQLPAILIVNFFLGWTFLGWVVALAMAFTAVDTPAPADPLNRGVPPRTD